MFRRCQIIRVKRSRHGHRADHVAGLRQFQQARFLLFAAEPVEVDEIFRNCGGVINQRVARERIEDGLRIRDDAPFDAQKIWRGQPE
jgi:hypothetical protein